MRTSVAAVAVSGLLLCQTACAPGGDQPGADNAAREASSPAGMTTADGRTAERDRPLSEAERYVNEGTEAYKRNRDQQAVEAFQQAVRLQPDYPAAHLKLGLAYAALDQDAAAEKEYETAVTQYKEFTRRNPEDADAYFNLGLAHTKLGEYEDAVKAYREAVRLRPDDGDKQYELGIAYTKLARYKEAVTALSKVIELEPENFRAADALERARAGLKRREAFLKQEEKAMKARLKSSPTPVALPQFKNPAPQ